MEMGNKHEKIFSLMFRYVTINIILIWSKLRIYIHMSHSVQNTVSHLNHNMNLVVR